ncbi:MAG TPA: sialate O-acetylesterase [Candidatus Saccharimonadales bacterium]|nr:sialate O-acetylesterase [Candidatus Saccharimonadales bacterium]
MKRSTHLFPHAFASLGFLAINLLTLFPARADVRLPHVFASDMVLQRDMPLRVWGWAAPKEKVVVEIGKSRQSVTANADGQWMAKLPEMSAGGPYELTVRGHNTIKLTGILIGEVWIASGQSNMEMGIGMCTDGKKEIAAADHPQIRLFLVPKKTSGLPVSDVEAKWQVCSPSTIGQGGWGGFSAAAYYFGREIHKSLNVPVGLIATSWGGTRIEPWTPPTGFAGVPALKTISEKIEQANSDYYKSYVAALDEIEKGVRSARQAYEAGKPLPALPTVKHSLDGNAEPTGLYNAMIHPLVPFAMRGAIWYQGESNNGEGMLYYEKMKALIGGWRQVWKSGDFPFIFVQIAPYKYGGAPTQLPGIWNAQLASLAIPNTGMAVTTDITTLNDIHPPNKQEVGRRLALWALAKTYGKKDIVYSGPLYKKSKAREDKIAVSFEQTGSGLATRDGKDVTSFEVSGEDGAFVPAQAKIQGNEVLVWADSVSKPKHVRFAWDQLAQPNLMNKEQLPASPFSTAELSH